VQIFFLVLYVHETDDIHESCKFSYKDSIICFFSHCLNVQLFCRHLLFSCHNISVSYLYCLVFALWTFHTILPKILDLIVLPLCLRSVREYSTRLHELFLLCYSDSVCQVTGDWRKLCNVKLLNVYYTVNIGSIRWAGRDHLGYLSIDCMIIVRWILE